MLRRTLSITFIATLSVTLLSEAAFAQGRGRGNRMGPPGPVGPPAGQSVGRPVGRPPFARASPVIVGRPAAAIVPQQRFGAFARVVRTQPQVVISQPYGGVYSPYLSPYIYTSPVYTAPVYGYGAGTYYGATSSYYGPYSPGYGTPSPTQNEIDLGVQVERLTREVEQLRLDQVQAAAAFQAAAPLPPPQTEPQAPAIPTVLIFRDGRRMSLLNYAIIGQTLWVLDEQSSTKIPLSDLDLEATQKENRGQGVRFPLPAR